MTLLHVTPALDAVRAALPPEVQVYPDGGHKVEGTGGVLVEVLDVGPIGSPGPSRWQRRALRVNVLADVATRLDGLTVDTADRRAWAVWERLNAALHDIDHRSPYAECLRINGPALLSITDGDGAVSLSADYRVAL